jgi:hypothetical protein
MTFGVIRSQASTVMNEFYVMMTVDPMAHTVDRRYWSVNPWRLVLPFIRNIVGHMSPAKAPVRYRLIDDRQSADFLSCFFLFAAPITLTPRFSSMAIRLVSSPAVMKQRICSPKDLPEMRHTYQRSCDAAHQESTRRYGAIGIVVAP